MSQVTISVGGRQYRLSCDEGEEPHLAGLGEKLDTMITELREAFGEIGDQRLTVMAAILALDRLDEAEKKVEAIEADMTGARQNRDESAGHTKQIEERFANALEKAAARIEGLVLAIQAESGSQANGSDPADEPA
ncbi:MAG TPA: cell division protein ZapA [Afifellaceae bacterium]|nr:cell division protein ZapA [Afifellaceae bacterium]